MSKILIQKEKKQLVEGIKKPVKIVAQKIYFIKDPNKDFSTALGTIEKKDLMEKDGSAIFTKNTKKEFTILSAKFIDCFKHLERLPQAIPLKDIGLILSETGINAESLALDTGVGSGLLTCYLAHICKQVTGYDINETYLSLAKKNVEFLGLKNITLKKKDLYNEKSDEKNLDLVTLDLPEPWNAIKNIQDALKIGGFLVSYSPTIPQVQEFVEHIRSNEQFLYLKTVELTERLWKVEGKAVRPQSAPITHSGFITFARKIC